MYYNMHTVYFYFAHKRLELYTFNMDVSEILKMDIFFALTSAVVFLFGLFSIVIFYYLIKIVRNISKIIKTIQTETEDIAEDFNEIKKDVKAGVHNVRSGISTATNYTKVIAGASIVKALSGLFEAFVDEKEQSKARKKTRKKKTVKTIKQ